MLARLTNRKDTSTSRVRSKDLMGKTGDRCNDLYEMSK